MKKAKKISNPLPVKMLGLAKLVNLSKQRLSTLLENKEELEFVKTNNSQLVRPQIEAECKLFEAKTKSF